MKKKFDLFVALEVATLIILSPLVTLNMVSAAKLLQTDTQLWLKALVIVGSFIVFMILYRSARKTYRRLREWDRFQEKTQEHFEAGRAVLLTECNGGASFNVTGVKVTICEDCEEEK